MKKLNLLFAIVLLATSVVAQTPQTKPTPAPAAPAAEEKKEMKEEGGCCCKKMMKKDGEMKDGAMMGDKMGEKKAADGEKKGCC